MPRPKKNESKGVAKPKPPPPPKPDDEGDDDLTPTVAHSSVMGSALGALGAIAGGLAVAFVFVKVIRARAGATTTLSDAAELTH